MIKENNNELQAYSVGDVAEFLQVSQRTIYKHLNDGVLKGFKAGNKWRFSHQEIKDYIRKLEKKANNDVEREN